MKNLLFAIIGLLFFFSLPSMSQTVNPDFVDGRITFKIKNSEPIYFTVQEDRTIYISEFPFLKKLANEYGIKTIRQPIALFNDPSLMRIISVKFDSIYKVDALIKELSTYDFDYVEKDPMYHSFFEPNDPYYKTIGYNLKWNLDMIKADSAWNLRKGKANIRVAVVDNAVWGEHEDLQIPSSLQYDATSQRVGNSAPPSYVSQSCEGLTTKNCEGYGWSHGTHCAGVVGALTNNNVGIASIGGGVTVLGVRASSTNSKHIDETIEGIRWAIREGKANVISLSLGGGSSQSYDTIVKVAHQNGIVIVAAAGNDNTTTRSFPAASDYVIAVASVDGDKRISDFSNYNTTDDYWIDVAAPGGQYIPGTSNTSIFSSTYSESVTLRSSFPGQNYDCMQGTSMACPLVAGLCGLMLSMDPSLTPDSIRNILQRTCMPIAPTSGKVIDPKGGIVNAYAALSEIAKLVPQARFTADKTVVGISLPVKFKSQSVGGNTTLKNVSWAFEGGSPATSTAMDSVTVTYSAPGIYSVKLAVENQDGKKDTLIQEYYINVQEPGTPLCTSASNIRTGDTLTLYKNVNCNPASTWGYISGHNSEKDSVFAERFINDTVIGIHTLQFNVSKLIIDTTATNSSTVIVRIHKEDNNSVGSAVYEKVCTYNEFAGAIALDSSVYVNTNYFVSYQISYKNAKDTVAIATSTNRGNPARLASNATMWVQKAGNWEKITDVCSAFPISLAINAQYCKKTTALTPVLEAQTGPITLDTLKYSSQKFVLNTNTNWKILPDASTWLNISPLSGTGNAVITVTSEINLSSSVRSRKIIFSGNNLFDTVTVTQKAAHEKLAATPSSITLPAIQVPASFNLFTNVNWTIEPGISSWITNVSPTSGAMGAQDTAIIRITFDVAENTGFNTRTDTIVIAGGTNLKQEVRIVQNGRTPSLLVNPKIINVNGNASTQTVTITSNAPWRITGLPSWVTATPPSGIGNATVTLSIRENTTGGSRNVVLQVATVTDVVSTATITINQGLLGIDDMQMPKTIQVYPNPVKDVLYVKDEANEIKSLSLTNSIGSTLWVNENTQETTTINTANLPKGIYLLNVTTKNGKIYFQKVVKQ